ncbi:SAM-dependent methyltransferase [Amycolatopsis sp. NPDC059021]|uniref:SAM-dependent methyltransferase n=1 Tax=Amycolatopsis sp. NPDC059021 TaxID=3346704 RepID=UPI00366E2D47
MTAMRDTQPIPDGVDLDKPNAARIYDWLLGGTANWAIDREFGAKAVETFPLAPILARTNREFLGRGVHYLARNGVDQFLDLGSGVPTVGNVHEIADRVNPRSRCVYVDIEPVAVAHARVLLERHGDPERHAVVQGDLREVEEVWERALDTGVLDPAKPIGLILVAVLHFIGPEDRPHDLVARYRDALPPGSYLLSSHGTEDGTPQADAAKRAELREQYNRSGNAVHSRTRAEFSRFFDGFDLVEPGVVWLPEWHLDELPSAASEALTSNPAESCGLCALSFKR